MTKRKAMASTAFGLVLLVITAYAFYLALGFSAEARRIPLLVGGTTVAVLAVVLVRELLFIRTADAPGAAETAASDSAATDTTAEGAGDTEERPEPGAAPTALAEAEHEFEQPYRHSLGTAFLWLAVLSAMFLFFGLLPAIVLFTVAFMRIYGHEKWWIIAVITIGIYVGIFGIFVRFLRLPVFGGYLDVGWW